MFKTDSVPFKIVLVLCLIFIIAGLCGAVQTVFSADATLCMQLSAASSMLALLFAGYYMIDGFQKNAAGYFKAYGALFALTLLFTMMDIGSTKLPFKEWILLGIGLALALAVILFVGRDLGKGKSFALCALIFLWFAYSAFYASRLRPIDDPRVVQIIISSATNLILSLLFGVMIYAKYADKAARGSK